MRIILLAACLSVFSISAHALPFRNGSFEDLGGQVLTNGGGAWGYFPTVPGWVGVNNIEIQKEVTGSKTFVKPQDGKYYAELNAHPAQANSFQFYQTFDTVAGQTYNLEFYAQKRLNNDGFFTVSVGDALEKMINDHVTQEWKKYSFQFTATGNSSTLNFLSGQSGSDTTGHYLDNISVTMLTTPPAVSPPAVSEPTATLMFGAGLLMLLGRYRNRKNIA
jgi:hypothetical protein